MLASDGHQYRVLLSSLAASTCVTASNVATISSSSDLSLVDYFKSTIDGATISITVADQPTLAGCETKEVSVSAPEKGKITLDPADGANSTIVYTPDEGEYGLDVFEYIVECDNGTCIHKDTAKIYVYIYDLQREYYGCEGAGITMLVKTDIPLTNNNEAKDYPMIEQGIGDLTDENMQFN